MVTTKKQALTSRLLIADQTSSVRKNGWCQTKRKPSLTCSVAATRRALAGLRVQVGAQPAQREAGDGVRQGVDEERRPGADGVQQAAERAAEQRGDVLTRLVLAVRRRQLLVGDHAADGRDLGRLEDALGHPGEQRDDGEVGDRERAEVAGDGEAAVEDDAAARWPSSISARRSKRSARMPAGSSIAHIPSRSAASSRAATRVEPVRW